MRSTVINSFFALLISFNIILSQSETSQAIVTAKFAPVYQYPNPYSNLLFTTTRNIKLNVLERKKDWVKIEVTGKKGWIEEKNIDFIGLAPEIQPETPNKDANSVNSEKDINSAEKEIELKSNPENQASVNDASHNDIHSDQRRQKEDIQDNKLNDLKRRAADVLATIAAVRKRAKNSDGSWKPEEIDWARVTMQGLLADVKFCRILAKEIIENCSDNNQPNCRELTQKASEYVGYINKFYIIPEQSARKTNQEFQYGGNFGIAAGTHSIENINKNSTISQDLNLNTWFNFVEMGKLNLNASRQNDIINQRFSQNMINADWNLQNSDYRLNAGTNFQFYEDESNNSNYSQLELKSAWEQTGAAESKYFAKAGLRTRNFAQQTQFNTNSLNAEAGWKNEKPDGSKQTLRITDLFQKSDNETLNFNTVNFAYSYQGSEMQINAAYDGLMTLGTNKSLNYHRPWAEMKFLNFFGLNEFGLRLNMRFQPSLQGSDYIEPAILFSKNSSEQGALNFIGNIYYHYGNSDFAGNYTELYLNVNSNSKISSLQLNCNLRYGEKAKSGMAAQHFADIYSSWQYNSQSSAVGFRVGPYLASTIFYTVADSNGGINTASFARTGISADANYNLNNFRARLNLQFEQSFYYKNDETLQRARKPRTIRGNGELAYTLIKGLEININLFYHSINLDSQIIPQTGPDPNITNDFKLMLGINKSL